MKNETINQKISPLILAIIIGQVIFMIILVAIIHNKTTEENKTLTYNNQPTITLDIDTTLSDDIDLSDHQINDISHSLTNTIELNTSNLNIPGAKAIIRNNSLTSKEFNTYNFKTLSFIVDIPNLEQSYQIYYNYPMDPDAETFLSEDTDSSSSNNLHILCIEESSQIIYPNFECHSASPSDLRYSIIQSHINLLEFDVFSTSIDKDNPHQINLKGFHRAIDHLDDSHIAQVKDAISSLGISPDLFTYHIKTE